ncbi:MAG: hypothetical protein Q9217_001561 [Psora testacea]
MLWSLAVAPDETLACKAGHLGLEIGDWWLNPLTLYRDNLITHPSISTISYDDDLAYAVTLTNSQETSLAPYDGTMIQYTAPRHNHGVFGLMKTMASTSSGKVVRIFRTWRLDSRFKPAGGVRYDGLYRILSYSVRLNPPNDWHYSFMLQREPHQIPLSSILHIPTADQLDDWADYLALRDAAGASSSGLTQSGKGQVEAKSAGASGLDSGYNGVKLPVYT